MPCHEGNSIIVGKPENNRNVFCVSHTRGHYEYVVDSVTIFQEDLKISFKIQSMLILLQDVLCLFKDKLTLSSLI